MLDICLCKKVTCHVRVKDAKCTATRHGQRTDELEHVVAEGAHQGLVALGREHVQVEIAHLAEHVV